MENTVIDMLIYDDYDGLNNSFNIPKFEAFMLCQMYKKMNYQSNRGRLINGITSGYYSNMNQIKSMSKIYIKNKILHSNDKGIAFLTQECGLNEIDAYNCINSLVASNDALNQSLSFELDTSSIENQMNSVLEYISNSFLVHAQGKGINNG